MSSLLSACRNVLRAGLTLFAATMITIALSTPGLAQSNDSGELVLVAGATGRTGQRVVDELLADGYRVRAFVRNIERARTVLPPDIEFVVGDIRQRDSVDAALKDVVALISSVGASFNDPDNSPEFVDYGGVKTMADAAGDAGLNQFVLVSSMGVTQEDHILNQRFKNVLIWKFKGEEAVRNSGVPYTIVRPGGLTDEPGGEKAPLFLQGDKDQGTISRADVARVLVAALKYPEAMGKTFELVDSEENPDGDLQDQFAGLASD